MKKHYITTVPTEKIERLITIRDSIADDPAMLFSENWEQLDKKQAWMLDTKKHVFLRSYRTIVAVFVKDEGVIYAFGRYSPSTTNHITRLQKEMSKQYADVTVENCELENWYTDGTLQEVRENKRYGWN